MPTLLSSGLRAGGLWPDTASPHPVASAEPPGAVDVVVVGLKAGPRTLELRHRPIPLRARRRAWLPFVSAWFRSQDARS